MKYLIYIWIIFISQCVQAQIVYEPIFINQITNQPEKVEYWFVLDTGATYYIINPKSKSVILPKAGEYSVYLNILDLGATVVIPNKTHVQDTILLPRLHIANYMSNPPRSEYLDDNKPAQGYIVDYYTNGNTRTKGRFNNGQPIDSVFSYDEKGILTQLFIPHAKGWHKIQYFENGKIQSNFNYAKREKTEYYPSGQLKKSKKWNLKYHYTTTEYDENGILLLEETNKTQKKFYSNGEPKEIINRKEILVFDRIFSKDKGRFYQYTWTSYNSNSLPTRKITFNSGGFSGSIFPKEYLEINDYLFNEVVFYHEAQPIKKIHYRIKKEGNIYVEYLILSEMRQEAVSYTHLTLPTTPYV